MDTTAFKILENEWILLADGRRLAARIWLPESAHTSPVPAILEYLPYRKRDGTAPRDESTYPQFAIAGYAGVRVDISGTGESDGDWDDEYSKREMSDALEVISWIADQSWCDGKLGMMGISWGGFNSLQIAALRPEPLKAIISIGSTVDRYNDDIHYKNGCLLYSNFSWASVMLCYASRPPDPMLVGDRWKDMWLHRLNTQPYSLQIWLAHQTRDEYWKHGSICENYDAIQVPALIISGWADGYINAPPAAASNLGHHCKAVNGPWIHKYPHFAWPKPRMDFVNEAINWWDRWLKNIDNKVDQLPAYRAFLSENVKPLLRREQEEGHWVAESTLPALGIKSHDLFLSEQSLLTDTPNAEHHHNINSPLDCGIAGGEIFTLKPESEMAGDQRVDDAVSLVFDTIFLSEAIDILGRPVLSLKIAIDKPLGNIIVRLNDVQPDGTVVRVSLGMLNLTHRKSNEYPETMLPGNFETIQVRLDECGYRFLPGHKIRAAISTHYWPMVMPPPEIVTATIVSGQDSFIRLPIRKAQDSIKVVEPTNPKPLPTYKMHLPAQYQRWTERDLQQGEHRYHVIDDTGEEEIPEHALRTRHRHQECWSIALNNPLSYRVSSEYICWMHRGDWSIKTVSKSHFSCDVDFFHIKASITAYEGEQMVNQREWHDKIKRNFI
ncbi:MAG: putative CocE/NonD family hydrolase [Gammaproteobacteria bacterium]